MANFGDLRRCIFTATTTETIIGIDGSANGAKVPNNMRLLIWRIFIENKADADNTLDLVEETSGDKIIGSITLSAKQKFERVGNRKDENPVAFINAGERIKASTSAGNIEVEILYTLVPSGK